MQAEDKPCPGGRDGLDVHPAFGADSDRLRAAAQFVDTKFLPGIRALASCDGTKSCRDPATESMNFVDGHQAAFTRHGMCVRAASDPEFDRNCFLTNGDSFQTDPNVAPDNPMACGEPPSNYQPYASRARWIRTANDSYFTAMTYPEGMPAILKPSDIHDALWGVLSAVYGGAVHPTAEGYAAMADAALPAVRGVLGLPAPPAVETEPLPPPTAPAPAPRNRACACNPARRRSDAAAGAVIRSRHAQAQHARAQHAQAQRPISSAGSKTTWCTETPAVFLDRRSGRPSAPSAPPRGSRKE